MGTHMTDDELKKKAAERVNHRIGLIIHFIFWIVISAVIIFAVDLNTGLMLFAFFGLSVAVNAIVYIARSRKSEKGYDSAVEREYEKMRSERDK